MNKKLCNHPSKNGVIFWQKYEAIRQIREDTPCSYSGDAAAKNGN